MIRNTANTIEERKQVSGAIDRRIFYDDKLTSLDERTVKIAGFCGNILGCLSKSDVNPIKSLGDLILCSQWQDNTS